MVCGPDKRRWRHAGRGLTLQRQFRRIAAGARRLRRLTVLSRKPLVGLGCLKRPKGRAPIGESVAGVLSRINSLRPSWLRGVFYLVLGAAGFGIGSLIGIADPVPPATLPEPGFSLVCGGATNAAASDWIDPHSGLIARHLVTRYANFNAVEWRLELEQAEPRPSPPIVEQVQAGDFTLPCPVGEPLTLHWSEGSHESATDFQPRETLLRLGATSEFTPQEGRSSDGVMPYFNLARHAGGGWIVAVGWTGQWQARFTRATNGPVRVQVGQQRFHAVLRPGEHFRTPAVLVMPYRGDWLDGQNQFRRLMLARFTPHPDGKAPELPIAASGATIGFNNFSESNQLAAVDNVIAKHLPVDTWWIDAGWMEGGFPMGQGNFDPDPQRFPRGLRPVADRAHAGGLRFLLWFEPERVMPGTWLRRNHEPWLLVPSDLPAELKYQDSWRLLNLGDPQALAWLKAHISQLIDRWGIDVYRQDCNLHPACYWRTGEPPNRVGLTEARYVAGLYDFLDFLLQEHPQLLIDNCASGGRRLDFEMMRRSVVLWRSDHCWQPEADQAKTYGLSLWLPLQGLGSISAQPYVFRSGMGSCATYAFNFYSENEPFWKPLDRLIREEKQVRHLFAGDFHPLTPWSTNRQDFIAWQFHRPDLGEGLVQAFRRDQCIYEAARFKLVGLDPIPVTS